nr:uncharacterized protein LOC112736003 [Arachis hypogaea]
MQVLSARILCMGWTTELLRVEERKETSRVLEIEKPLKERDEVIIDATSKIKSKEEEMSKLHDQIQTLQGQIKDANNGKGKLISRVHELENEVLKMFEAGCDRAMSQVTAFSPDFGASNLDVTKIMVNGKLVDDEAGGKGEDDNVKTVEKFD